MKKVKFENITISRGHSMKEYYIADMKIDNKSIPVELQKASNGDWIAISEKEAKIYMLDVGNRNTIDDWSGEDEGLIVGIVPPVTF